MPGVPDTIVACASPPGRSDRALLRLSGPAVGELAALKLYPPPLARTPALCDLALGGSTCPAIAMLALGPASYTGEDTLELLVPGNPHLVERVLAECCAHEGVRRAGPGEFSARAYLAGRLSLDRAEGVAALIAARNADDLDAASRLARGETGRVYRAWADELATLLALVEAGIDFTDQEDVVAIGPARLRARLGAVRAEMSARASGELAAQSAGDLPLVVLLGEPNAGKSTLFNALLGRRRSIVADQAGTTRDVLIETLYLDALAGPGLAVQLADLPGLDPRPGGAAHDAAQVRARDALARADAVVHCDPRGRFGVGALDPPASVPVLRVRTKADLPGRHAGDIEVCAMDGWHLDTLRRGIADIALRAPGASCSVALARHAREIALAVEQIAGAEGAIDPDAHALAEPELVADRLRAALDQLEHVLGRVTPDEVIGRIFATFCVGK